MSRRKQVNASPRKDQRQQRKTSSPNPLSNKAALKELLSWYVPRGGLIARAEFHGNTMRLPEQLAIEALIWSWQESSEAMPQTISRHSLASGFARNEPDASVFRLMSFLKSGSYCGPVPNVNRLSETTSVSEGQRSTRHPMENLALSSIRPR